MTGILTIDADGRAGWWSQRTAVLPPVEMPTGAGFTLAVDPADLARPLAWVIEPGGSVAPLAFAFGDAELADVVAELAAAGESVTTLDCPPLEPGWRRRCTVAAVARWTTRPVHQGALLLDEAMAEHLVGHRKAAVSLFGHAEYALPGIGEWCRAGSVPEPAIELFRAICGAAAAVGLDTEAGSLLADLEALRPIDDAALLAALARWTSMESGSSAVPQALTMGAEDGQADRGVALDLTLLPPRIIAWQGAGSRELLVNAAAGSCTLRANLATGVDPYSQEVAELLAFAADAATGTLVAIAPTAVDGDAVVAEIPLGGADPGTLHFGLYGTGTRPGTVRSDPLGRALAAVDRELIEAWNQRRAAAVLVATAGPDRPGSPGASQALAAETAAGNALDELEALLESMPPDEALTARTEAVRAYLDFLLEPPTAPEDLLLTDLLPAEEHE